MGRVACASTVDHFASCPPRSSPRTRPHHPEGWEPPADNGGAIRLPGDHGALPSQLARLRKAVGFRNVLVHDYIEVNDDVVIARPKDLDDLEEFVRGIARYVSGPQA